jgi:hypothetical protein
LTLASTTGKIVNMSNNGPPDIRGLPDILEFDAKGRLTVRAAGKRIKLPVITLADARLATVSALTKSRTPHVIVAPHLSTKTKALIEAQGWSWLETNGSAHIASDGIFVHIERADDRAARRPGALLIPPQGERIVRHLLDSYPKRQRFTELAQATKLDQGYTSRILGKLRDTGLVSYQRNRPIEVPYPAELFELWQTMPSRIRETTWFVSNPKTLHAVALKIRDEAGAGNTAFTGVFAASLVAPRIDAERIDCYVVDSRAATRVAERIEGESAEAGYNVSLLIHRDPGVLAIGAKRAEHLTVVSPAQIYRDTLQRGRGREREAASVVRNEVLNW